MKQVIDLFTGLLNPSGMFQSESFTPGKNNYSGSSVTTQKYNDVDYSVDLYLDNGNNLNSGSESTRYYINPASVLSLVIEESIANWVAEGSILVSYLPDDSISEKQKRTLGQGNATYVAGAQKNADILKSYQFRSDGFDILRFCLTPNLKNSSSGKSDNLDLKITANDPKWTLSYLFSIYEIEDVNDVPGIKGPLSTYVKCVKLYFRDLRYQILRTTNLEYSTSLSTYANFNSGLANGYSPQGTLKTGRALNEIFNLALTDSKNGGDSALAVDTGANDWDEGSCDIFYTSPAQWSAADDISYLYGHHVSSKTLDDGICDIPLLHTKRSQTATDIAKINLSPISLFFEDAVSGSEAGKNQIEHFFVTAHTSEKDSSLTKTYMAPFSNKEDRDLKTFKYGQIVSYSFVDMSPDINSTAFSNTPVYSVDIGRRTFQAKFENNTVEKAREIISKNYISKLYKGKGDETKLFLPTLHEQKSKSGKNLFPVFTLNGDQIESSEILRQKNGITQLLYTGLFQNTCICFSTFGLTVREAGKIIAIDKLEGAEESDYNTKLFGQWFVVKVVHSFETGAYMNLIFAIKLHRFTEAKLKFAKTI